MSELVRKAARAYRFVGPIISLASGLVSVFLFRRGIDFAPVAVAAILFAWMLAGILVKRLAPRDGEHGIRGVIRFLANTLISGAYQNVLFFLLPVWFGSATLTSPNLALPCILALMAGFTCFDALYTKYVVEHPAVRAAFSAVVLFATLVAAAPIFVSAPLRVIFASAAAFSVLLAAISALPYAKLRSWKTALATIGATVLSAVLLALAAPMFPPVPVQCTKRAAGTAIVDRELDGVSDVFETGVEKVYVWFAVAAPDRYSEKIRFEVFKDGQVYGKPFETEFTGGRKSGFRTWTYISQPRAGDYRVDLYASSDQLVGRYELTVRQP